jgi:hypothetical protein
MIPMVPLISYFFLIIYCSLSTGVILKKRRYLSNAFIIIFSFIVIVIISTITAGFNIWDGGDFDLWKGGFKTVKELSAVVFWVIIVIGSYYAVLIVFLDVIHALQETSKFYDYLYQEIIQNKFNFVQHTAEFFDFQNNLLHLQNIANIFLAPCVALCLSACAVGLIFEIFGFEARFSAVFIGRFSIEII